MLAVHLLLESKNPKSFFRPYIDILPTAFSIPLFFQFTDLVALKGSPVLEEAIKMLFNTARQYLYLQRLLKVFFFFFFFSFINSSFSTLTRPYWQKDFKIDLSYAEFRWAVSVVMTRQNQIPLSSGKGLDLALIPVWDMCNHADGEITTFFNSESQTTEFQAMQDFKQGDQVFIFYGKRPNSDLLLYSGFVYGSANKYDCIKLKFTLNPNDPLSALKAQVLESSQLSL